MNTLLQINTVINTGSTGRIAEDIGLQGLKDGWNSYIAYGRGNNSSQSNLIKIGSHSDVIVHGLQTRLFDRHGLGSRLATQKLIGQIKEIGPDVIHLHNLHGYYLNIEILFDFLAGADIPVAWTLHDCWPVTGHCAYFDFVGCEKWKTECHTCPQISTYPASYFLDRSLKNFRLKKKLFTSVKNMTLVPVSSWLAGIIQNSFLADYPVKMINNGIDTETFKPISKHLARTKVNIGDEFMILGVASTWSPRKGLKDFIELSRNLPRNSRIVLLGLDKKQLTNLPANIIGLARTETTSDLVGFYSAADVFINPTWEDNFPTTNLESLACGTPVITYNTGGSVESVSSQTGFIVEKGDIQGLSTAIEMIRRQGKDFYSGNCVEHVKRKFDKNDRYKDYFSLYDRVISKH